MAETSTPTPSPSSGPSTPPSSAAEQARIRKERREAKIRAGASARLNKITGLGGGIQRDPSPPPTASPAQHADPEEVDISQHYYEPSKTARSRNNAAPAPPPQQQQLNDQQLRQMMLGFDPASTPTPPASNPFASPGVAAAGAGAGAGAEDPMLKLLQQAMMGGVPGEGAADMPAFAGMPNAAGPTTTTADPYANLWRIIHAVFALGFGLYIAFTTQFTGSRADREASGLAAAYMSEDGASGRAGVTPASVHFFWVFATAEVLLQTSRFFVEKGRVQSSGMLGMVAGFLPEPYKGYVALVMRYSRIWTTISADAMALVFVLGVCAWWRGT